MISIDDQAKLITELEVSVSVYVNDPKTIFDLTELKSSLVAPLDGMDSVHKKSYQLAQRLAEANQIQFPSIVSFRNDLDAYFQDRTVQHYLGMALEICKRTADQQLIGIDTHSQLAFLKLCHEDISRANFDTVVSNRVGHHLESAGGIGVAASVIYAPTLGPSLLIMAGGYLLNSVTNKPIDGIPASVIQQLNPEVFTQPEYREQVLTLCLSKEAVRIFTARHIAMSQDNARKENCDHAIRVIESQLHSERELLMRFDQGVDQLCQMSEISHQSLHAIKQSMISCLNRMNSLTENTEEISRGIDTVKSQLTDGFERLSEGQKNQVSAYYYCTGVLLKKMNDCERTNANNARRQYEAKATARAIDQTGDVLIQLGQVTANPIFQKSGALIKASGNLVQEFSSLQKAFADPESIFASILDPVTAMISIGFKIFQMFKKSPLSDLEHLSMRLDKFIEMVQQNFSYVFRGQAQIHNSLKIVSEDLKCFKHEINSQLGSIHDLLIEAANFIGMQDYQRFKEEATQAIFLWENADVPITVAERIQLMTIDAGLCRWGTGNASHELVNGAHYAINLESIRRFSFKMKDHLMNFSGFTRAILDDIDTVPKLPKIDTLVNIDMWQSSLDLYLEYFFTVQLPKKYQDRIFKEISQNLSSFQQQGKKAFTFINQLRSNPMIFTQLLNKYIGHLRKIETTISKLHHQHIVFLADTCQLPKQQQQQLILNLESVKNGQQLTSLFDELDKCNFALSHLAQIIGSPAGIAAISVLPTSTQIKENTIIIPGLLPAIKKENLNYIHGNENWIKSPTSIIVENSYYQCHYTAKVYTPRTDRKKNHSVSISSRKDRLPEKYTVAKYIQLINEVRTTVVDSIRQIKPFNIALNGTLNNITSLTQLCAVERRILSSLALATLAQQTLNRWKLTPFEQIQDCQAQVDSTNQIFIVPTNESNVSLSQMSTLWHPIVASSFQVKTSTQAIAYQVVDDNQVQQEIVDIPSTLCNKLLGKSLSK